MSDRRPRVDLRRLFIKQRLRRGTGASAAREALNALVALNPDKIAQRWGSGWSGLAGQASTTPAEVHKIQSALSRRDRRGRQLNRAEFRFHTETTKAELKQLKLPEPRVDYQKAHDAGVVYRTTQEERWREVFEEGSP